MSQDKQRDLVDLMLDEGLKKFEETVPVMELTENGYVQTGDTQKTWQAKDVAAFTSLLKMLEYKHVDGISNSAEEMRQKLSGNSGKRAERRKQQHDALPPLSIVVNQ